MPREEDKLGFSSRGVVHDLCMTVSQYITRNFCFCTIVKDYPNSLLNLDEIAPLTASL